MKCLNNIQGKLYEIKAQHLTKLKDNFKPYVKKDGSISDTQFIDVLQMKIDARVMLIYNVAVSDLLCNGAMGTVIGVEESTDGRIEKVIVKFDNPKAGKESRKNHPAYAKKYPGGTVITKMEREYTLSKTGTSVGGSTAKLIQYPLILAFAVTVYKIQGQTIDRSQKCVVDLRSVFDGAQAYVMLSRMKELDQLYILEDLPENKIYPVKKALDEILRLQEVSINRNPIRWDRKYEEDVIKISYLNCRSILTKFDNIKADMSLQQSDILVLAETWIPKDMDKTSEFEIEDYAVHLNSTGRGKGLAVFYKMEIEEVRDHDEDYINITMIESKELDVVAVYRSNDGSFDKLIGKLLNILDLSKSTLVIGDMNVCSKKRPDNELKIFLEGKGFKQIIRQSTHIEGGHLNHAYILNAGNFEEIPAVELIPKYYSDHDAVCISWKKNKKI